MQVSNPSYWEKEAGSLCSKPQATLSCMLIKILPHKDNDTSVCTVQTQWTRKSESPTLVEDRQQIRSQCSDKITVLAC